MTDIASNLADIRRRIAEAARGAGREAAAVELIAVSKGHSLEAVEAALAAGQRVFGENRVQETLAKFGAKPEGLRARYPEMRLHLIGPLQTNKAGAAIGLFDVIETLDRPALADALAAAMKKQGRAVPCLIEVNIGNEPQKAGIAPEDLGGFLDYCRGLGLAIEGLMCIPPQAADPAPYFKRLGELARRFDLPKLSMGMSADFEDAVSCGATEVRVGSAIFGDR